MPESKTNHIDYYPEEWVEEIVDDHHMEWRYQSDESIVIRLIVEDTPALYYVSVITGYNDNGEEYVTSSFDSSDEETAFDVIKTLLYAVNSGIRRINGDPEFYTVKDKNEYH